MNSAHRVGLKNDVPEAGVERPLYTPTMVQNFIRGFGSNFRKPKFGSLNPGALAPEVFLKTENKKIKFQKRNNIFSKMKKCFLKNEKNIFRDVEMEIRRCIPYFPEFFCD